MEDIMNTKTIALSGAEVEVAFSGANGRVFLLGTGSMQLIGSDYSANPFKTSAQAGGSGVDDVARAAIEAHAGNAEIHVTAAEKAAWDGKLPFVGMVEDLFAVNKTCVCAWNSGTLNTPYKAGLTGAGGGLCIINNASGSTYTSYIVMESGGTSIYSASSNAGVIRVNWIKVGDGGNAETVGGKSAGEFVQYIGKISTSEIVDDPNYPIAYECSISPGTAQEIGLSGGWYHLKYFKHPDSGDIGWGAQIVLPLNNSTLKPMYRFARNTSEDWGTWHSFADGGNAASVGAYTEAKLAELEARVAALEGN